MADEIDPVVQKMDVKQITHAVDGLLSGAAGFDPVQDQASSARNCGRMRC